MLHKCHAGIYLITHFHIADCFIRTLVTSSVNENKDMRKYVSGKTLSQGRTY